MDLFWQERLIDEKLDKIEREIETETERRNKLFKRGKKNIS